MDLFADTMYLKLGKYTYSCKINAMFYRSNATPSMICLIQLDVDTRILPFEVPADLVLRGDGKSLIPPASVGVAGIKVL